MTRLCTVLTVIGGLLLVAGLATGLVGEVSRVTTGRGWRPAVGAAEILIVCGMFCGAALLAAVAGWHVFLQVRRPAVPRRVRARRVTPAASAFRGMPRSDVPLHAAALQAGGMQAAAPYAAGPYAVAPHAGGPQAAGPQPPAQQKIAQLKDLYREAEEMGDEELSAHWEEIRRRQHELIREYFEQARLASTDIGQGAR